MREGALDGITAGQFSRRSDQGEAGSNAQWGGAAEAERLRAERELNEQQRLERRLARPFEAVAHMSVVKPQMQEKMNNAEKKTKKVI